MLTLDVHTLNTPILIPCPNQHPASERQALFPLTGFVTASSSSSREVGGIRVVWDVTVERKADGNEASCWTTPCSIERYEVDVLGPGVLPPGESRFDFGISVRSDIDLSRVTRFDRIVHTLHAAILPPACLPPYDSAKRSDSPSTTASTSASSPASPSVLSLLSPSSLGSPPKRVPNPSTGLGETTRTLIRSLRALVGMDTREAYPGPFGVHVDAKTRAKGKGKGRRAGGQPGTGVLCVAQRVIPVWSLDVSGEYKWAHSEFVPSLGGMRVELCSEALVLGGQMTIDVALDNLSSGLTVHALEFVLVQTTLTPVPEHEPESDPDVDIDEKENCGRVSAEDDYTLGVLSKIPFANLPGRARPAEGEYLFRGPEALCAPDPPSVDTHKHKNKHMNKQEKDGCEGGKGARSGGPSAQTTAGADGGMIDDDAPGARCRSAFAGEGANTSATPSTCSLSSASSGSLRNTPSTSNTNTRSHPSPDPDPLALHISHTVPLPSPILGLTSSTEFPVPSAVQIAHHIEVTVHYSHLGQRSDGSPLVGSGCDPEVARYAEGGTRRYTLAKTLLMGSDLAISPSTVAPSYAAAMAMANANAEEEDGAGRGDERRRALVGVGVGSGAGSADKKTTHCAAPRTDLACFHLPRRTSVGMSRAGGRGAAWRYKIPTRLGGVALERAVRRHWDETGGLCRCFEIRPGPGTGRDTGSRGRTGKYGTMGVRV